MTSAQPNVPAQFRIISSRVRKPSVVSAQYHKSPPQAQDANSNGEDTAKVEKLRPPILPVVVMHAHLHEPASGVLHLLHHLQADDSAVLRQMDALEHGPSDQPEIAVHVSDPKAEHQLHHPMVNLSDYDAMERIVTLDFVSLDHFHVRSGERRELLQLTRIILRVAIRVENPLLRCRL